MRFPKIKNKINNDLGRLKGSMHHVCDPETHLFVSAARIHPLQSSTAAATAAIAHVPDTTLVASLLSFRAQ